MSCALYVDGENIKLDEGDFMFLQQRFHIDVVYVYTNPKMTFLTLFTPIKIIEVTASPGKNSVDIQIAVDVIESLYTSEISHYIIASHDRDFIPLYKKIQGAGRKITVVGHENISETIKENVDDICCMSKEIDTKLKVLLKAFLIQKTKRSYLSLTELKKNIKKMNARKQLTEPVFKNLVGYIESTFSHVFQVEKRQKKTIISCQLFRECSVKTDQMTILSS